MILTQAGDARTTLLRVFALPPVSPPAADGKAPPETPVNPSAELPVPGWVSYPPAGDGERLALVTDFGQFRLFGVNQPGSLDRALFPYPPPRPPLPSPPDGTVIRGLVLPAEEAAFWVLANGTMQKFRLGLIPSRGLEVTPVGPQVPLGEPTQPPQLNARKDSACLIVRSLNSDGYKAVLVRLSDGEVQWQRQLGVIPASVPLLQEGSVILAAKDGGLVSIPGAGAAAPGRTTVAPPAWVIKSAPENATGATRVALSPDGRTFFTLTPIAEVETDKTVQKYLIRRVTGGEVTHTGTVNAPAPLAGQPVVFGETLLIPATDGFIHRYFPGTGRTNPDSLVAGPAWASATRADAECFITPTSDSTFLTNDGTRKLTPWVWPKAGRWGAGSGTWELRERPAGPGVVLPAANAAEPPRLLIADVSGTVWLFPADRGGQRIRQWRPGGGLPAGKPTSPFAVQLDGAGRTVVAYTVEDRSAVCLDPESDLPKWVVRTGEDVEGRLVGAPQPVGDGRWLVTDLGGRVTIFDAGGAKVATLPVGLPGVVPAVAPGIVGRAAVVPLSDGSSVLLPLPSAAPPAPDPKPKE
jgi:hypothetical protein